MKFFFVSSACVVLGATCGNLASAQVVPSSTEFHGYARLGVQTADDLVSTTESQGSYGLPISRHVRDLNYLRFGVVQKLESSARFHVEAQLEGNLPHASNDWSGSKVQLRNVYYEAPANLGDLWFGARRMEFEDVRLFDAFPLSDSVIYGMGLTRKFGDAASITALGIKENSYAIQAAKNVTDPSKGNVDLSIFGKRSFSLFQRFEYKLSENSALRPTIIVNHTPQSQYSYKTVEDGIIASKTNKQVEKTDFTLGAVLGNWGADGWNNTFAFLKSQDNRKDYAVGVAVSGDYEGGKDLGLGVMYALSVETTQFQDARQEYKLQSDLVVPNGAVTAYQKVVLGFGLQPVYYLTEAWHAALDMNYSMSNKVGIEAPNHFLVTPILRYAAAKNAMGTPQFFASVTYGAYEAKSKSGSDGVASKHLVTTQTGFELWF